jgi:hypothetical protein
MALLGVKKLFYTHLIWILIIGLSLQKLLGKSRNDWNKNTEEEKILNVGPYGKNIKK